MAIFFALITGLLAGLLAGLLTIICLLEHLIHNDQDFRDIIIKEATK